MSAPWPSDPVEHRDQIAQSIREYGLPGLALSIEQIPVLSDVDRAVLDAAEAETSAEDDFIGKDSDDYDNADWAERQAQEWIATVATAREARRAAVRARRDAQ